ncbi:hypothetical protein [Rhodococcus marinonascens]|uniref:hypothetical protein n=1 Tax=Rhodococcus marinonascens TaxID=38311 RepID=UPI00093436A6|nr:hypothetical protein [Rhodococcus marinonascens]
MSADQLNVENLNETARILARSAVEVDEAGSQAPAVPNAGPSTAFVGDALVALADAMSQIARSSARAADIVASCDANYTESDQTNADELAVVGERMSPTPNGRTP